jgi:lipopolysaccharide/colanic/teichoic acid biosynthesis glycosyltransferase
MKRATAGRHKGDIKKVMNAHIDIEVSVILIIIISLLIVIIVITIVIDNGIVLDIVSDDID